MESYRVVLLPDEGSQPTTDPVDSVPHGRILGSGLSSLATTNNVLHKSVGEIEQIESVEDDYSRFIEQVGAIAMGSTTYEWIVEHENLLEDSEKWPYEVPAWVFSSRELPMVDGANIRFVQGDVSPIHDEMVEAADGKNVWLVGGGDLVGQFHDNDLLDEIILSVAPVMLSSGAPLLPRSITTPPLKLANVQTNDTFAVLTYEVQRSREVQRAT